MATLEKIRSKAGLLVGIVGLALFAFIIGDFLNSGSTYFRQSKEKIAEINGEVIKIQEYQDRINEMADMYKSQTGQTSLSEEYMAQIRESVFGNMVREIVLDEEAQNLGLVVTPEELFDMVQGENISPMIQQMQMFVNPQTGVFDKAALLHFLKTIEDDNISQYSPEQREQLLQAKNFWLFWEKNIKQQRLENKYTTLLGKAIVVNAIDAKEIFDETAQNADVAYTMQSYASIPDSTIQISNSDVEKLYNKRKEMFKQKEGRILKYIVADILPSEEDHNNVSKDIEELKDEFKNSQRVAELVNENSEIPYVDVFFTEAAFDPQMKKFVETAEVGEVFGPAFEDNKFRMFKLVDKTVAPDSVKVSHIMLASTGNETETAALADSLKSVLKGGADFTALAREYSVDRAAENGGELGWFTEATALRGVNEDFKNAIFSMPVNDITIVKSPYGTHLVKVTEKTGNVNKYKIADIEMTVSPSSKTYTKIYNDLNQLLAKNGNKLTGIDELAKNAGYKLISGEEVTADNQLLRNMKNTRQVIRWAFKDDRAPISEIFECDDKFIVASVEGTLDEGYRPLKSVASTLKQELIAEKKGDKIAEELAAKKPSSLQQYAELMNGKVDSVKFVSFATRRIAGIGIEPKLNALVSITDVDKLSEPVKGNNGVYVFKVYDKSRDAKPYDEATQIKTLEASNAYRFSFLAIQELINKANVKDTRVRYF